MYFGLVYGILFDGRIPARHLPWSQVYRLAQLSLPLRGSPPRLSSSASRPTRHHTKFTKISTKTRKRKNQLDGTYVVPSPVPLANQRFARLRSAAFSVQPAHTKLTKISEMHEKGDRGGGMEALLFLSWGAGGRLRRGARRGGDILFAEVPICCVQAFGLRAASNGLCPFGLSR